jgi:KAP family P-loop domain
MSQQEKIMGYKFNILHEDVADKDLLEDQTHFHVSENMYQLIQASTKGVTIGLEGTWGSGKSTVINLLRNKLQSKSESNSLFFMFDAWAHDGDPLRRIFLESLVNEIDPNGTDEALNDISGRITGRRKTVRTESTKTASKFGKLLSICALTIPLGSALMNKVNYDLINFNLPVGTNSIYWQLLIGLIFCGSPFLLIALWAIFGERDRDTKKIRWDFFTTESTENSTQDVTEDGERTSIEFEAHFENIIKHAINVKKVDRIVIVIDNLDRVDPSHAKNIWSTLQTFFQKRSNNSKSTAKKWEDKLWFIIPFDRNGFSKIWDSQSNEKSVSISFLKKCFQIIAEVPEPVMSAWPDYTKKTFALALNEWPEKEKLEAIEAFIRFASHLDKSPTPRDIKVLANQIGLLGMRWGGVASSEALCVYALYRQQFSEAELRKKLLADGLPESYVGLNDSKTLKMEIAGLLFGVTKEKGIELLLTPEINLAIRNGDGELLKNLAHKHGEAFWITWRPNRIGFIPNSSHTEELKISATIAICNGLSEFESQSNIDISMLTSLWKNEHAKWSFKEFDYSLAIKNLIEVSTDKASLLSWLSQFVEKMLEEYVNSTKDKEFSVLSLPNFRKLIETAEYFGLKLKSQHYSNLNAENWKIWNQALDYYNLDFPSVLPAENVVFQLAKNVNFNQLNLDEEYLDLLLHTINMYPTSSDWPEVTELMINWSGLPNRHIGYDVFYLLLLRLIATQDDEVSEKIISCVKADLFWRRAKQESIENSIYLPILAAISLDKELNESLFVNVDCIEFWSEIKDESICQDIYNIISDVKRLDSIWLLSTNTKNKLAIEIIKKSWSDELFKCECGTWYLDEYEWASEEELKEITENLCNKGSFESAMDDMKNRPSVYAKVFKILKNYGNLMAKEFVVDVVGAISKEQWSKYLTSNNDLLYCVEKNNHKYSDALVEYFLLAVSEADFQCDLWPYFQILIDKCCDGETIAIPKLLNSYLESKNDCLNIEELAYLLTASKNIINACNKNLLMQKIIAWMDCEEWDKINLLLSFKIDAIENPLQGLLSRMTPDLNSFPEKNRQTITKLRSLVAFTLEKNEAE